MERQVDKRKEMGQYKPRGSGRPIDKRRQHERFLECKSIGPTPPLNKEGFWKKPDFNQLDKEFKKQNKLK